MIEADGERGGGNWLERMQRFYKEGFPPPEAKEHNRTGQGKQKENDPKSSHPLECTSVSNQLIGRCARKRKDPEEAAVPEAS